MTIRDQLAPFHRRGKARPLTANDYARMTGMTRPQALGGLLDLTRQRLIEHENMGGRDTIYDLTDMGRMMAGLE